MCTPQVAKLVTAEFFEQGDKEREELNVAPIVRTLDSHSFCHCLDNYYDTLCLDCCRQWWIGIKLKTFQRTRLILLTSSACLSTRSVSNTSGALTRYNGLLHRYWLKWQGIYNHSLMEYCSTELSGRLLLSLLLLQVLCWVAQFKRGGV